MRRAGYVFCNNATHTGLRGLKHQGISRIAMKGLLTIARGGTGTNNLPTCCGRRAGASFTLLQRRHWQCPLHGEPGYPLALMRRGNYSSRAHANLQVNALLSSNALLLLLPHSAVAATLAMGENVIRMVVVQNCIAKLLFSTAATTC